MRRGASLLLILLMAVAAVPCGVGQAADPPGALAFTVDELVTRALAENPELQAARAEVEAARGRLLQAGLRPNPMLDVGFQKSVTGPDNNVMAGVTLPLDLNRRQAGRLGVAERELALKEAQVAERERMLRAEVRLKAGELLAARRHLRITEELLDANRQALGLMQQRVRRGAAPSLDENLMAVEVNRLDATREVLGGQVEVLGLQLGPLLGLESGAPLSLRGELNVAPAKLNREEGLRHALTTRPDLLAAQAEVDMAGAKVRKEEAEGRWDASVNVGYMRQDFGYDLSGLTARGELRPITDVFHYVGGGVTVTLPVRNRNQGNIAAALAGAQAGGRRLDAAALMVRQEVAAAFAQREAAERALATYTRGVLEVARQNLAVVRKAYELGRHPLLYVITEQRRYIEVEMGYTEALKRAYDAGVEVERALGLGLGPMK
jgi:cobalt-zinc-cadmium efflux system outer membrane protein